MTKTGKRIRVEHEPEAAPSSSVQEAAPEPSVGSFLRILVGDELGLVKFIAVAFDAKGPQWENAKIEARWGEPDKKKYVTAISVTTLPSHGLSIAAVARQNGTIDLLTSSLGAPFLPAETLSPPSSSSSSSSTTSSSSSSSAVCSISWIHENKKNPPHQYPSLISCTTSGLVRIHSLDKSSLKSISTGGKIISIMLPQACTTFQTCSQASCMALDSSCQYMAVGGEGCNVQVWDLTTAPPHEVFKAKGGKPDKLGLVDKVNCTSLAFLPGPALLSLHKENEPSIKKKEIVAVEDKNAPTLPPLTLISGTAGHKLYVYQPAIGRRPQVDLPYGETRVTALLPDPSPSSSGSHAGSVWAANGEGSVEKLDLGLKGPPRVQGGLKGATGSVRALAAITLLRVNEDEDDSHDGQEGEGEGARQEGEILPLVSSVGLDRYLRVYHAQTRKCLLKTYLKQHLTAVCMCHPYQQEKKYIPTAIMHQEEEDHERRRAAAGGEESQGEDVEERRGEVPKKKKKKKNPKP